MTVMLELKPETEKRVNARAKSLGLTIEHFLVDFIEEKINGDSEKYFYETASDEEWLAELDSLAEFSDKTPTTFDDSRESIYGERENLQI